MEPSGTCVTQIPACDSGGAAQGTRTFPTDGCKVAEEDLSFVHRNEPEGKKSS